MDLGRVQRHRPAETANGEREAAVIVPVIERTDQPQLLFTKRADHLPDHPGQMSFPGGKREASDGDLRQTALREGDEEICLDPTDVSCVGRLDDILTVTRFAVRPFVAQIPDREYIPCDGEVAEVATLPVEALVHRDNYVSERRDHPEHGSIRIHFFTVNGYTVWGATARILVQFLELATDWTMPGEVDRTTEYDADMPV
jgi:8-oxo-dGTP pyrophosphatase MutT (NUDIX family)